MFRPEYMLRPSRPGPTCLDLPRCICRSRFWQNPPRNCFSDIMLGELETNPARFVRTGLLRGRLHLTSATGHASGVHPPFEAQLLSLQPIPFPRSRAPQEPWRAML